MNILQAYFTKTNEQAHNLVHQAVGPFPRKIVFYLLSPNEMIPKKTSNVAAFAFLCSRTKDTAMDKKILEFMVKKLHGFHWSSTVSLTTA